MAEGHVIPEREESIKKGQKIIRGCKQTDKTIYGWMGGRVQVSKNSAKHVFSAAGTRFQMQGSWGKQSDLRRFE